MILDRDQIKRDAYNYAESYGPINSRVGRLLASHCLALLTELEQAEKGRDEARRGQREIAVEADADAEHFEARLAKVPPLVEAAKSLTQLVDRFGLTPDVESLALLSSDPAPLQILADYDAAIFRLREALNVWGAE